MEQALRALLAARLPELSDARINWGEHPQDGGAPYVVMHLISVTRDAHMQGPGGMERSRVQIDCYGPTFGAARGLAGKVMGILDFHRAGGFRGILFAGMRQLRESGENAGEAIHRASLDFIVNWRDENG